MKAPATDSTRAHWDRLASGYDQAKARNDAYYAALKSLIAGAVPPAQRGRVLEVGCGTGQILASLQSRSGVGIDLSPAMIEVARSRWRDRTDLRFEVMDAAEAARLGPFDAVISSDVLEHVEDWSAAVTAMVRAAAGGAVIVITTPNPRWAAPLWALERLRLKMPEGPHRFVAATHIARRLDQLGCTDVQRRTHLLVPARLGGLGPALSRVAERLPGLRRLGVIQCVAARAPAAR
jgi:2-polyprenyl-3-methyl-5-hydroxy-6-metoxy-1,4-benzoquinol methylase